MVIPKISVKNNRDFRDKSVNDLSDLHRLLGSLSKFYPPNMTLEAGLYQFSARSEHATDCGPGLNAKPDLTYFFLEASSYVVDDEFPR